MNNHSIHARAYDPGVPDLPPFFEDGMYEACQPAEPPKKQPITAQPKLVRVPVKIARAIAGTTEVRLLRQSEDGAAPKAKPVFIIEQAVLQPYHAVRTELQRKGKKGNTPMSETEAMKVFEAEVATRYPAEQLRSGRRVPIHQVLL